MPAVRNRVEHVKPGRGQTPRCSAGPAFTLIELIISLAVIALLMATLLPALSAARRSGYRAVCAGNLRQIAAAWLAYTHDNARFPRAGKAPDWSYGGVRFSPAGNAELDPARPVNRYLTDQASAGARAGAARVFRCPSDVGVFTRDPSPDSAPRMSVLGGGTCFATFGTSYRANPALLDSTRAGIDQLSRALAPADIFTATSDLLMVGDAAWWYATRPPGDPEARLEASWHGRGNGGHLAAVDGSVRFAVLGPAGMAEWKLNPRPVEPR